jgi:biotin transport system substrate-specific component
MDHALALPRTTSDSRALPLIAKVLLGSLLLALSAQVAIPLPFSPVPLSLQSTMVISLGICLGKRAGLLAVVAYLLEGIMGLPVFAAGHAGIQTFLAPSGGYLIGFLPGAYLAGMIASPASSRLKLLCAYLVGSCAIFALGIPHLALFVGWKAVLVAGLLPFIPGDLVKSFLCATFIRRYKA